MSRDFYRDFFLEGRLRECMSSYLKWWREAYNHLEGKCQHLPWSVLSQSTDGYKLKDDEPEEQP